MRYGQREAARGMVRHARQKAFTWPMAALCVHPQFLNCCDKTKAYILLRVCKTLFSQVL